MSQESTTITHLNLARKYRPTTLDTIVGQETPLRMLKNSLYRNIFFPVYLFSGQRGCGKTSTARIFARAVNCDALEQFQKAPTTQQLPCMNCQSCTSVTHGNHPDFIEIDGASHTGVDNVRTIIEASSYFPVIGRKKVYLIDEAHMLSKAAFNAFLKILEEPPNSVIFILATTELQKIPATVLSRCFQAQFPSLKDEDLITILRYVCISEEIPIEENALSILAREAGGSARDALNLLEQVRLHDTSITHKSVTAVLGNVNASFIIAIISSLFHESSEELLTVLQEHNFEQHNPTDLWDSIYNGIRSCIWLKHNLALSGICTLSEGIDKNLLSKISLHHLYNMLQLMGHQEEIFMRTSKKHATLELTLLLLCNQINNPNAHEQLKTAGTEVNHQAPSSRSSQNATQKSQSTNSGQPQSVRHQAPAPEQTKKPAPQAKSIQAASPWQQFINELQQADLMLHSIFASAQFHGFDEATQTCTITLKTNNTFITESINDKEPTWKPLIKKQFSSFEQFTYQKSSSSLKPTLRPVAQLPEQTEKPAQAAPQTPTPKPYQRSSTYQKTSNNRQSAAQAAPVDIKNKDKWPQAHLLISYFPGTIKKNIDN